MQIPIHFQTEDFNHGFPNYPEHSNEFLLPSARLIFSSQESDQIPPFNDDLDILFEQAPPAFLFLQTEQVENALQIPQELGPNSELSANSLQDELPGLINEGLESGLQPLINLNSARVLPLARDFSQYAVVLELLDIRTEDLERRIQYRRAIKATIERRRAEMGQWNYRIEEEIGVNRHQCRQLYGLLESKAEVIRAHCRARMREVGAQDRAILENFPIRYNTGFSRLRERVQEIERTIQRQDKRAEKEKAMLEKKYEERQRKHGKKKSLYYYEVSFVREVKRQFELEKDLRDAFVGFIREIKPTEEEERVLNIEPIMREVYIRGDNLMAMMHWVELKEDEGPLKMNEKVGFLLGNPEPKRVALTIDRFLVVYRMDLASREFSFEKQIKVADVKVRRDEQNLNRMIVKEVKSGFLWGKGTEFSVELGNGRDVEEFIQDFGRYY